MYLMEKKDWLCGNVHQLRNGQEAADWSQHGLIDEEENTALQHSAI